MKKLLLPIVLLLLSACSVVENIDTENFRQEVGPVKTDSESIGRQGVESVDVTIKQAAGELTIQTGTESLVDTNFVYNIDEWKPEVNYTVTNVTDGALSIEQPSFKLTGIPDDSIKNEWYLTFNNVVPLAMDITAGAGKSDLDLSQLNLIQLKLTAGAGSADVKLPAKNLSRVDLRSGVGLLTVDFRGEWLADSDITFEGGLGKTVLILPANIGIRARAKSGIGSINTVGNWTEDDGVYTNELYNETPNTLRLDVSGGVGQIELRLE